MEEDCNKDNIHHCRDHESMNDAMKLIPELKSSVDKLVSVLCGSMEKRGWMSEQENRIKQLEEKVQSIYKMLWWIGTTIGVTLIGAILSLVLKHGGAQ